MPHSYTAAVSSSNPVDAGIVQFFESFYALSDTPSAHDRYSEQFTDDATFILASTISHGRDEILATRKAMWASVASRLHTPMKIFAFDPNATEVMLYGTVAYERKDGRKALVDWAARAEMVKEGEVWRMGFYQVYMDTAALANAK